MAPTYPVISVIIPVWQEAATIVATLQALKSVRHSGHEVIVVDGGSDDGTCERAARYCDRVFVGEQGRAVQMNKGAAEAKGDVLLFLHADTQLPSNAADRLGEFFQSSRHWGRFDVRLSEERALFRLVSWLMNQRSWLTGIATGDQAMFVRRSTFEDLGGFANIPLMEDVEFSGRLKRVSRPYCISDPVVTDSRRWQREGAWRTILLMWRLRWRYWRGESPDQLAKVYQSDVRKP
ncbi:MAG: TIGR04283 family arsenosugar biosynthesis glycosyltransferase [Marinobacter sp.]|uniref:TIGR04283 family arsenosugar biosynthesis glycosyltransferase n=1 Tax=Marinobacter sp. TaxID=50741 RepID=UPI0034A04086